MGSSIQHRMQEPRLDHPPSPPTSRHHTHSKQHLVPAAGPTSLGLDGLSLIDRARALCAAAEDVQKATLEATQRIAAIHGTPERRKEDTAPRKPIKEPPDVCARPPSDIPPPRGEGWRRLGQVSVIRGSNQVSVSSHVRRALARDVEVSVDGGRYPIVPNDINHGGGSYVTLGRDFEGETNMVSMLYMRKTAVREADPRKDATCTSVPNKVTPNPASTMEAIPAPFGSVGGTDHPSVPSSPPPLASLVHEVDIIVKNRSEDDNGRNSMTILEAQNRARRRAREQKRRASAGANSSNQPEVKKTTPTEVDRLEASRRAAQARVASVRHLEAARKERMHLTEQQCMRQKEAEARAKASALRSAAVARAVMAATYMRRREQELQEITEAEAHAKRERVAGVLAPKDSEVLDRERQLRVETYRRIRQQERRKEAAQKHQEEMIRQDEVRRTIPAPSTIHSARSCFSITGSTSASEPTEDYHGAAHTTTATLGTEDEVLQHPNQHNTEGAYQVTQVATQGAIGYPSDEEAEISPSRSDGSLPRCTRLYRDGRLQERTQGSQLGEVRSYTRPRWKRGTPGRHVRITSEQVFLEARKGGVPSIPERDFDVIPVSGSPPLTAASGARSAMNATVCSTGSSGKLRMKINTTPVWKRPAVPLSKPYIPVPHKDTSHFTVR